MKNDLTIKKIRLKDNENIDFKNPKNSNFFEGVGLWFWSKI